MRVLVLGNELIAQRLAAALGRDDIEVEGPLNDLPAALDSIDSRQFDLVVIDSLSANLRQICDYIFDLDLTPVSLMLNENTDDWKSISTLKVDGFLSRDASDNELRIRVKATCRRKQVTRAGVYSSR